MISFLLSLIFSWPGQSPGGAIVLPLASALAFYVKVFYAPRRNFGWHIKIAPSGVLSVRQSVRLLQIVSQ